jgi:hypothetical protein
MRFGPRGDQAHRTATKVRAHDRQRNAIAGAALHFEPTFTSLDSLRAKFNQVLGK